RAEADEQVAVLLREEAMAGRRLGEGLAKMGVKVNRRQPEAEAPLHAAVGPQRPLAAGIIQVENVHFQPAVERRRVVERQHLLGAAGRQEAVTEDKLAEARRQLVAHLEAG